jgi:flagellar biogenesis protein FliO
MKPLWLRLSGESSLGELLLYVLAVALVLWLCWRLSKFVSKKTGNMTNTNNIRILERVNVAQDKGLVIAEICGEYYLLSFSNERVDILMKLDEQRLKKTTGTAPPAMQSFKDVLRAAFKNGRWDMTGNDRKHKD